MTNVERKRAASPHQHTGQWISKRKRLAIYLRDGFECAYCEKDLHGANPSDITLDHFVPLSKGGTNSEGNLITVCRSCNCKRGNKPVTQFLNEIRFCGFVPRVLAQITRNRKRNLRKYILLAMDLTTEGNDTCQK